jgi:hypothetical protein
MLQGFFMGFFHRCSGSLLVCRNPNANWLLLLNLLEQRRVFTWQL